MKRFVSCMAALCATWCGVNAADVNTNCIPNGILNSEPDDNVPSYWARSWSSLQPYLRFGAGPGGTNSLLLQDAPGVARVLQGRLFVAPQDAQFRMSCLVRTKNFKADKAWFIIQDDNWNHQVGFEDEFPENSDWHKMEKVVTLPFEGMVSTNLYFENVTGELELAQLSLKPVDQETAKQLTNVMADMIPETVFIPSYPALERIMASTPQLQGRFFGKLPADAKVRYRIDNGDERTASIGSNGEVILDLSGTSEGNHQLKVVVGDYSRDLAIHIDPAIPAVTPKRLNNLAKVLNDIAFSGNGNGNGKFVNPRDGWVLFKMPETGSVTLDKSKKQLSHNQFFFLPAGEYGFTYAGPAGTVRVNAIAETFLYPVAIGPMLKGLAPHDAAFARKYQFPVFTTFNGNDIPPEVKKELRDSGSHLILGSVHNSKVFAKPEAIAEVIRSLPAFDTTDNTYDGVTLDEVQGVNAAMQANFSQHAPAMDLPDGRSLYVWVHSGLTVTPMTSDFVSRTLNLGHGRGGKIMYESYALTAPTLEGARKNLDTVINRIYRSFDRNSPGARQKIGAILGHSSMPLHYTFYKHPEVNYKYYLDLQFNRLANAPELDDIGTVGYWGDHYADEEISRFAAALVKHYVIEGQTELFTEGMDWNYRSGHLVNGDFTEGLKSWKTQGNVKVTTTSGYAEKNQKRWLNYDGAGDSYAVFTRNDNVNTLSQTVTGLTPGELYKIQFITFDASDLTGENNDPAALNLTITIQDGELLPEHTARFRAEPKKPLNVDQRVFRANKTTAEVVFSDEPNQKGAQTGLNFVALHPYFEAK